MRKIFNSKKVCKIIVAIVLLYTVIIFTTQMKKLRSYENQKNYYNAQISELKDEQGELLKEQENINSPEYIQEQARKKLDMYYPNERVYIAQQ